MQAYAKLLIPVSLLTGMLGAAAGYALHVPQSVSPIACNSASAADRTSTAHKAEPVGASPWAQQSTVDWSWKQWPSLTDF